VFTVTSLQVSYTGEQWRLGTAGRGSDRLDFEYSTDATSLTVGTYTGVTALSFSGPITTGAVGALDGNAAPTAQQSLPPSPASASPTAPRSTSIGSISMPPVPTTGLAVDDFSITPNPGGLTLSVSDVSLNEGNAGTTSFQFTVSLSAAAGPGGVTFDIATSSGTASAGSDFTAQSLNQPSHLAGATTPIRSRSSSTATPTPETNETFTVTFTNLTGATASKSHRYRHHRE